MKTTVLMRRRHCSSARSRLATAEAAEKLCTGTSKAARQACRSEVKDDFFIATGICLNLSTKDARKACKAEAKVAAKEAKEECGAVFEARELICDALGQGPYDPVINPADFLLPDQITAVTAESVFPARAWHRVDLRGRSADGRGHGHQRYEGDPGRHDEGRP